MKTTTLLLTVLAVAALAGCKSESAPAPAKEAAPAEASQTKEATPAKTAPVAGAVNAVLLNPSLATDKAPARFVVQFETTKGPFKIEVRRSWAPHGAERIFNLVRAGFFDDVAFFRAIDGFMVQFGISGNPKVAEVWRDAVIPDDPVGQPNTRGRVSFATSGPNSRTTQIFINYSDNRSLDQMGFAPFGVVVEGMEVVDSLYKGYGEGAPRGKGPNQAKLQTGGNDYLRKDFPMMDYVKSASIVPLIDPAAD